MNENNNSYQLATFAGGCFWCMQPPFERLEGVISTTVGYSGGMEKDPTYEEVASGMTGHTESIQIVFDPEKITYKLLLEVFWRNIDPTQINGQFADRGTQYRTAIFFHDEQQKEDAEESKMELENSGKFGEKIVTPIEPYRNFYKAENYHQMYYEKNPVHYSAYKKGSGREGFIRDKWGK